jgi:hypothetical protein
MVLFVYEGCKGDEVELAVGGKQEVLAVAEFGADGLH